MTATIAARPLAGRHGRAAPAPWLALTGAAALALVALTAFAVLLPPMLDGRTRADLRIFLRSSAAWLSGRDPYAPMPFPNLNHPALVVAAAPLTRLSFPAAFAVWSALTLLAYAATVAIVARVARPDLAGARRGALALLAVSAPGLMASLLWGQVGVFLGLAATFCWVSGRRGRWLVAGVYAGLLIALKPSFLPLAVVFLARGRRRGLAGLALGGGGLSLAALPFVGVAGYAGWLGALLGASAGSPSISLTGFVIHLSGRQDAPWHLAAIIQVAAVLAAAALCLGWPRRGVPGVDRDVAAALLLAILGMPLGWAHYTATLAPVAGVLLRRRRRLAPAARGAVAYAVGSLWLPAILSMGGPPIDQLQTLALLATLAVVLAPHLRSGPGS